ncbi:MAG: hypothetical protein ACE37I_11685 [Rubinisphaera brasiliensis]|uniref:hypothetical protein n=1 Tax=Rubinisphaera brasiliensis TaxID=119 RepID=UPI00391C215B
MLTLNFVAHCLQRLSLEAELLFLSVETFGRLSHFIALRGNVVVGLFLALQQFGFGFLQRLLFLRDCIPDEFFFPQQSVLSLVEQISDLLQVAFPLHLNGGPLLQALPGNLGVSFQVSLLCFDGGTQAIQVIFLQGKSTGGLSLLLLDFGGAGFALLFEFPFASGQLFGRFLLQSFDLFQPSAAEFGQAAFGFLDVPLLCFLFLLQLLASGGDVGFFLLDGGVSLLQLFLFTLNGVLFFDESGFSIDEILLGLFDPAGKASFAFFNLPGLFLQRLLAMVKFGQANAQLLENTSGIGQERIFRTAGRWGSGSGWRRSRGLLHHGSGMITGRPGSRAGTRRGI